MEVNSVDVTYGVVRGEGVEGQRGLSGEKGRHLSPRFVLNSNRNRSVEMAPLGFTFSFSNNWNSSVQTTSGKKKTLLETFVRCWNGALNIDLLEISMVWRTLCEKGDILRLDSSPEH